MKNPWVYEKFPLEKPTSKVGLLVKKRLFKKRSAYQKIEIVDTYEYGKVLILDDIFQTSEADEFIYHEMMAHLPLFSHRGPKNILIIGGGDGGVLREVLKHAIEKVYLVEIDKIVLKAVQKFMPNISQKSFKNKKAKIFIDNGAGFIKNYKNFFDVVIIDSSDPGESSKALFSQKFYQSVFQSLKKNGLMITQSGGVAFQLKDIKQTQSYLKRVFPFVDLVLAPMSLYQEGLYTFSLGSKTNIKQISQSKLKKRFKQLNLKTKYYCPEIHQNSFFLPKFLKDNLD